jgi:hypothetical protein
MNRLRSLLALALAFALVASTAACGGGGKTFESMSVDKNKPLKDLNEAEKKELIEVIEAEFTPYKESVCLFTAIFVGALASAFGQDGTQACTDTNTKCATEPIGYKTTTEKATTTCEATVGELSACYTAQRQSAQTLKNALSGYSCTKFPSNEQENKELQDAFAKPAACEALEQKCPDFGDKKE